MKRMASVLIALAAVGCGGENGPAEATGPELARAPRTGAAQLQGTIGPGAIYALYRPDNWNGELIVYAHGFIDPAAPIALPTADQFPAVRDQLLGLGYGIAYTSFSENGFAVKDGMQRVHQLRALFGSRLGQPERTYVMGHSLGGGITVALAERFGTQFDGALAMCGMIGGSQAQIDYLANVRLLFDFFYPGALPGSVAFIPEGLNLNTALIAPAVAAMTASPAGAGAIASIAQTPVPFASGPELVQSIVSALGFHFRGFTDLVSRTHGELPFDNSETVYTGALPPATLAAINATVPRFDAAPQAANYVEQWFQPTGEISIPILTLHTSRDPSVPIFHETLYQALVAAAGNSDLLVQRTITRYGHCTFTVQEMVQAFVALREWAVTGVEPAS